MFTKEFRYAACARGSTALEYLLKEANPTLFSYWIVLSLSASVRVYEKRWITYYRC